jgi:ribulose-phosphate 3-epimerase
MSNYIAPSILAADYLNLQRDIKNIEDAGAQYLHIDIMDGSFVPSISFGEGWVKQIKAVSNLFLDVHLMAINPIDKIQMLADAGANQVGIHQEAVNDIDVAIDTIIATGIKAEIAINPDTPVAKIESVLNRVNQVLVMTVTPGKGGQKFMPATMDKIKELVAIRQSKDLSFDIEVDGGINDETGLLAAEAGANVFVAGSFVFDKIDPANKVQSLQKVVDGAS